METLDVVPSESALSILRRFVHSEWRWLAIVSGLVCIPCIWHTEIEAGDLGSHVYNAWLVQLIQKGQIHGLWVDHRWNNVLFDYALSAFASFLSLRNAERIAVSLTVLIFFWGTFALVSAFARRAAWYLLPVIAMVTYGWTFEMGLFNYYLALGLSFWALAIAWRGVGRERLIAVAIVPFIILAHPLGLFWLAGATAYVLIAERLPLRYQIVLLLAASTILLGIREYLWRHSVFVTQTPDFYKYNGADQFVLFGPTYTIVGVAALMLILASAAWDVISRKAEQHFWTPYIIPLQLYILTLVAVVLLPHELRVLVSTHVMVMTLISQRLTTISAVFLCCLLAAARPRRWQLVGFSILAAFFFSLLYRDTGRINRMENQIGQVVRTLPPGQRVIGMIVPPAGSRLISIQHILDRVCIGYCFNYANYEPGSDEFRVRAEPGNPYVLPDYSLVYEVERGEYSARPGDLPLFEVYQCGDRGMKFCVHALAAGQKNDAVLAHLRDLDLRAP